MENFPTSIAMLPSTPSPYKKTVALSPATPTKQDLSLIESPASGKRGSAHKADSYLTPNKRQRKASQVSQISTILHPSLIDDVDFPTDTELDFATLLNEFPRYAFLQAPPLVLVSQLYSVTKDRTSVDRELEQMKNKKYVKMFRLLSGKTDYFVVKMSDYLDKIQQLKEKYKDSWEIFDRFVTNVVPKHTDVYITKDTILRLLYGTEPANEKAITLLVNAELLLNRAEVDSYWFRVPFTGTIVTSIVKGRKEIVSMLKRQKFKELLLADMKGKKLRYSDLPIEFLVKDMIGLGMLERIDTTSGPLIRLLKEEQ